MGFNPRMHTIAILGPTASGKSTLALALAQTIDADIVCCDSMVVYRNMDIGTAKPSLAERASVRHHMLDYVDIHTPYHLQRYLDDASQCIAERHRRGRNVILCGGTGLYARALLYGYRLFPTDPDVAATIDNEIAGDDHGDALYHELANVAPDLAKRVQHNKRRLARAVEILRITGNAPGEQTDYAPMTKVSEWRLLPPADVTRRRVHARAKTMLAHGWIEETEALLEQGLLTTPTASQALGYAQIADYLAGKFSRDQLVETIVTLTCRYAKRQRTWFRNQHPAGRTITDLDRPKRDMIAEIVAHWESTS